MKYEEQVEFAELFPDVIDEVILQFLEDVNLTPRVNQQKEPELPKVNVSSELESQESTELVEAEIQEETASEEISQ
jgi:hypothetical protein